MSRNAAPLEVRVDRSRNGEKVGTLCEQERVRLCELSNGNKKGRWMMGWAGGKRVWMDTWQIQE